MSLSTGTRVGPYEILSALGAGGMGEVYRARDTKLDRDVAIKVLPAQFVADPERVARFQREAKTLAALNHPHIGGIYGLEDAGGVGALVLELVEGPTLADRIVQGPIPLDETLPIARQIAEALEAAHEAGIIHRDLKPANIKLRPDGTVKVLDFGLAKALEPTSAAAPSVTASPTITGPGMMTGVGLILGTAAYMSPEQAKGKPADKRSDIWSFGCVLYEMLTGERAFDGEDVSETLAAILRSEPNWNLLVAPRPLVNLIQRCLAKDRRRRLQAIGDARLDLDEMASTSQVTDDELAEARGRRATVGALWPAILIAAASIAAATAWTWRIPTASQGPNIYRTTILTPGELATVQSGRIALSPDGRQIAFVALDDTGHQIIWIRHLDEARSHVLPGTEGGSGPFWSPDSRYVAFVAARKLKKVAIGGGAPL